MFGRKKEVNERTQKINELSRMFEELKQKASNPNLTNEELEKYQADLNEINNEIDSLLR